MDPAENLICDITHPIFDIIENITRRQVLRLIACEHNYGNRIANILNLSTPAVHRHLKILLGKKQESINVISEKKKTKESYSGRKGAEATLYEIKSKAGLFFSIFPNFVHSQIYVLDDNGKGSLESSKKEKSGDFEFVKPYKPKKEGMKQRKKFLNLYNTVQDYNKKILELESELMDVLNKKNDSMGELDEEILQQEDLEYEHRVIMRAITCLGEKCSDDLSHLLNMDDKMIAKYIDDLKEKKWLEKSG
ncbi:MAG: hypothetical protein HeimC2_02200 [Candidatus Heimdallarchaeota archaeon LC_2]|nr:MAG: hypothetical protein HeimC2_02200 [Candidatus Heimdallarchaeota archaeon LC_2]